MKELTNVDISETLESIASKYMDTISHQILHVIVDGEISNGRLALSRLYSDDQARHPSSEGAEAATKITEMKVAHIMLQEKIREIQEIELFCRDSLSNRTCHFFLNIHATVKELREKISEKEGIPASSIRFTGNPSIVRLLENDDNELCDCHLAKLIHYIYRL